MNIKLELVAKEYAEMCHRKTNHLYNNHPYEFHLKMVVDVAREFLYLVENEKDHSVIIAACWCHDVIEDTRQTYNDVKKELGEDVAEIVYALTNEKGKTRKERANDKYYEGIRNCKYAAFVKVCDRIANMKYSISTKSSMADMYANEMHDFGEKLFTKELAPMFKYMNDLIINQNENQP